MVAVAEAVVDEIAMMVEFLDTTVTEIAVVSILRSEVFAVDTNIVEVIAFVHDPYEKFQEILLFWHITWVHQCQKVKNNC